MAKKPKTKKEETLFGIDLSKPKFEGKRVELPKTDFVSPLVRVANEKHILESLLEDDEAPEIVSVGYMKMTGGSRGWVSYTIKTKGREVVDIEVSEPDLRDIAEESAKIAFVNLQHDETW